MAAYLIAQVDVQDVDIYKRYAARTPEIVAKHGGRILARGGATETLEGHAGERRVIVIEFPTMKAARRFYDSPEYQEARRIRTPISEAQILVVQGVE